MLAWEKEHVDEYEAIKWGWSPFYQILVKDINWHDLDQLPPFPWKHDKDEAYAIIQCLQDHLENVAFVTWEACLVYI
jgi:hypothetical protein